LTTHHVLEAPEEWVDRYGDYLYRFALARTSDPDRAEDLVQETFLAALKSRGNFKQQSSPKTWLTAILKHKIIDYLRKANREQTWDSQEALDRRIDDMFNVDGRWSVQPRRWRTNPGDHIEQKEFMDMLYLCLAELPKRIARIFMMREMEGASTDEICQVMEITSTNCWTMLYRARNGLQRCLQLNWFDSVK
jgi:RNA polymerase sigma-70 factor (TIGR02943 family)